MKAESSKPWSRCYRRHSSFTAGNGGKIDRLPWEEPFGRTSTTICGGTTLVIPESVAGKMVNEFRSPRRYPRYPDDRGEGYPIPSSGSRLRDESHGLRRNNGSGDRDGRDRRRPLESSRGEHNTRGVRQSDYGYDERERNRERDRDRDRYQDGARNRDRAGLSRRSASPSHRSRPHSTRPPTRSHSGSRSPSAADKAKPNFAPSGLLAAATNTVKAADGTSTVLKYNEPPEARKPILGWRLYVFKGTEQVGELIRLRRVVLFLNVLQNCYIFIGKVRI